MKTISLFFFAFFICCSSFCQDFPILSASTRQYLWKQKNLYQNSNKILNECVYRQDANGRIYLSSFIQVTPALNETDLRNLDIIIGSKSKNIWTAYIPLENVNSFTQIPGIKYIDLDRPSAMDMDSAKISTRVDSVHAGINLPQAYTGNGVVVGIMDIGFDYTHPGVFDTSYSRFRLKRVWEQKTIGTPPSGFSFGAEFTDSLSIFTQQTDDATQSHGTHVSGIAAGSGFGTSDGNNVKYRGMAYESDIVYVGINPGLPHWLNTGYTDFMDGINYIFDYATSQGKPAVANLSWGPPIGPHDGLGLFSQALDNATGPGKIFAISAGNNRGTRTHLQKQFSPTDSIVKTFLNFHPALPSKTNWADIWGDTSGVFRIKFNLYSGATAVATSSVYTIDDQTYQVILIGTNGDSCLITLTSVSSDVNGKSHMLLDVENRSNYTLLLNVSGQSGKVDMWQGYVLNAAGYYSSFSNNAQSWAVNGDDDMTCSDAASGNSTIAVAAYNSKISYVNTSGNTIVASGETYGDLCTFSSQGPSADGRTKPNIAGPGSRIVSSINSFSGVYNTYSTDTYVSALNGNTYRYAAIQGTSMSSPAVTGIIALLLDAVPTLDPLQVQTILYNTAILDTFTGAIPFYGDNDWGWGKVNAYGAIKYSLNSLGIYHDTESELNCLLYPNPSNGNYVIEINTDQNENYTIDIFDLSGKNILTQNGSLISGSNTILIAQNFVAGVYLVKVKTDSGEMNVKVVVE